MSEGHENPVDEEVWGEIADRVNEKFYRLEDRDRPRELHGPQESNLVKILRQERAKTYPLQIQIDRINQHIPNSARQHLDRWKEVVDSGLYKDVRAIYGYPTQTRLSHIYQREIEIVDDHKIIPEISIFQEGHEPTVLISLPPESQLDRYGKKIPAKVYGKFVLHDKHDNQGGSYHEAIVFLITDQGVVCSNVSDVSTLSRRVEAGNEFYENSKFEFLKETDERFRLYERYLQVPEFAEPK